MAALEIRDWILQEDHGMGGFALAFVGMAIIGSGMIILPRCLLHSRSVSQPASSETVGSERELKFWGRLTLCPIVVALIAGLLPCFCLYAMELHMHQDRDWVRAVHKLWIGTHRSKIIVASEVANVDGFVLRWRNCYSSVFLYCHGVYLVIVSMGEAMPLTICRAFSCSGIQPIASSSTLKITFPSLIFLHGVVTTSLGCLSFWWWGSGNFAAQCMDNALMDCYVGGSISFYLCCLGKLYNSTAFGPKKGQDFFLEAALSMLYLAAVICKLHSMSSWYFGLGADSEVVSRATYRPKPESAATGHLVPLVLVNYILQISTTTVLFHKHAETSRRDAIKTLTTVAFAFAVLSFHLKFADVFLGFHWGTALFHLGIPLYFIISLWAAELALSF